MAALIYSGQQPGVPAKSHQQLEYIGQHHLHHGHHAHHSQSGGQVPSGHYHHSASPSALLININPASINSSIRQQQQSPTTIALANQSATGFNAALLTSNDIQAQHHHQHQHPHQHHQQQPAQVNWPAAQTNESLDTATAAQIYSVSLNQQMQRPNFVNPTAYLIESRPPPSTPGSSAAGSYHSSHSHHHHQQHHHHLNDERLVNQFISSSNYDPNTGLIANSTTPVISNASSSGQLSAVDAANNIASASASKTSSKHGKNHSSGDNAAKSQSQFSPKSSGNFPTEASSGSVPEGMQLGMNGECIFLVNNNFYFPVFYRNYHTKEKF